MGTARLLVHPLDVGHSLRDKAYHAVKQATVAMNIYATREELRLDERQLTPDPGVSRTPGREAIPRLEPEGFVRAIQRRGGFVVCKSKRAILAMIRVWAALERADDWIERSVIAHKHLIEALQRRETEQAERLARRHTLGWAAPIERHWEFKDTEFAQGRPAGNAREDGRRAAGAGAARDSSHPGVNRSIHPVPSIQVEEAL